MGKSKKQKFSLETDGEVHNNVSSIDENKQPKMKNKKKSKTPLSPNESKLNQEIVCHDEVEPIKKKKIKSENNGTEANISESLANGNEETPSCSQVQKIKKEKVKKLKLDKENETVQSHLQTEKATESKKKKIKVESPIEDVKIEPDLVNQKKSKKRKSQLMDESVLPSVEEATDSKVKTKKMKKEHLADQHESNVEESESGSKAKKRKLKHSNLESEGLSHETKATNSEPNKKSKKKFKNKTENDDEASLTNEDSRDSRTIFIGNIPLEYNKKAFKSLLKTKGTLMRYWTRGFIPVSDKISKKTAAIANLLPEEHPPVVVYALFKTAADAQNALTLNGAIFEDHRLRVTLADKKQCSPELGVFVGNLPMNITDDDLYDFFNQCGKIVSTRVVRNQHGKGRGVAFVNFESSDSVELALKLNEEKLHGREIRVNRMKNKRQLEKMNKRRMLQATKDALFNKKHKTKKTEHSPKKSEKLHKKKNPNSVEFKKKVLAEKLTSTTKRKKKNSE